MEFYTQKLRKIRKNKKLTSQELAHKMGISRLTLCAWENAKRVPSEPKIRMLARLLDVSVNEISDLSPDKPISDIDLSGVKSTMISLLGSSKEENQGRLSTLVSGIMGINKELSDAKLILEGMISSLPMIFYVKGSNLRYITANEAFLKNISLKKTYNVIGKSDFDFFPSNEAKVNYETDREVLATGKSILDMEGYIPGSRKTKWGIVSKTPIFDSEGKIEGVIGSFVDITKRKLAEEVREILEDNINEWRNCLTVFDQTENKYAFVSKAIERITGYPIENFYNITNFNYDTCIHPDDKKVLTPYMNRGLDNNYALLSYRIIRADGQIRKISTQLFPGKKEYIKKYLITLSEDITEKT